MYIHYARSSSVLTHISTICIGQKIAAKLLTEVNHILRTCKNVYEKGSKLFADRSAWIEARYRCKEPADFFSREVEETKFIYGNDMCKYAEPEMLNKQKFSHGNLRGFDSTFWRTKFDLLSKNAMHF